MVMLTAGKQINPNITYSYRQPPTSVFSKELIHILITVNYVTN